MYIFLLYTFQSYIHVYKASPQITYWPYIRTCIRTYIRTYILFMCPSWYLLHLRARNQPLLYLYFLNSVKEFDPIVMAILFMRIVRWSKKQDNILIKKWRFLSLLLVLISLGNCRKLVDHCMHGACFWVITYISLCYIVLIDFIYKIYIIPLWCI
jgi:hypothetical protein